MGIDKNFAELMDMFSKYNFDYILTSDLNKWKQGINQEYLLRKRLQELIDELGYDSVDKLMKIVKDKIEKNMLYDIEDRVIDFIFLPYRHLDNCKTQSNTGFKPSQNQLYRAQQNKLHDKPSEKLKTNHKGFQ